MLLGRDRELETLVDACRAAAEGRGMAVVLSGEAGVGKTALLAAAAETDETRRTLRATGVAAERAVAFATLHALLWPVRGEIDELEAGQAALLKGVLNLGPQRGASTFAVGAAVLGVLSLASREAPIVAVVDDAHWADAASQDVLCFIARRLEHERVALLAGVRKDEPNALVEEPGFVRLDLDGLERVAARELLGRSAPAVEQGVAERILDACAGSPLGLIELPRILTDAQLRGREPLPVAFDAGPLVQRAFAARASRLNPEARRALLLLAAAGDADAALLARAGVRPNVLDEPESVGLIVRGPRIDFRHPLMRAAVYGAAGADERREAHRRLAGAVDGARRAWHLAEAATGPDEAAADALEAAARDARLAGGVTAQAQALERAADLTPDRERRVVRLLEAARAWRQAGRMEHVDVLLAAARGLADTPRLRAETELERGRGIVRGQLTAQAIDLLAREADNVAELEPKLAARLLAEAAQAAEVTNASQLAVELAERAFFLAGSDGDGAELAAIDVLLAVRASIPVAPDQRDAALLQRAAELVQQPELRAGTEEAHWIAYCLALHEYDAEARSLSDRALAEARVVGDVWSICFGLYARAAIEQTTGRVDLAYPFALDALALAEQVGEVWRLQEARAVLAEVEAARGDADACEQLLTERQLAYPQPRATVDHEMMPTGFAFVARREFELAIARFEPVLRFLETGFPRAWYHLFPLELAEAYIGAGRRRDAEDQLRRAGAAIEGCWLARPRAKLARVRALLVPEAKIDGAFAAALAVLDDVPQPLESARIELDWGERLAKAGRSAESVAHLSRALAAFTALGAEAWADRARTELARSGGSELRAQPRRSDELTAQELRIARHAAAGLRNREIAARLYLSPRTVEWHLQSAYRKLEVTNRTQLAAVLASEGVRSLGPVAHSP